MALLAALSFLPFALFVAALVLVSKQAGNIGNLVVVGLSLAGGVYYPPELMPRWTRWLDRGAAVHPRARPAAPPADRHWQTTDPPGLEALRLAAFAVIMTPAACWLLAVGGRAVPPARHPDRVLTWLPGRSVSTDCA